MPIPLPTSPTAGNCSTCMLGHLCVPVGMSQSDVTRLTDLVQTRLRLRSGVRLYTAGDTLDAIYAIRFGSVKTQIEDAAGHVQITGFFLPGELLGMPGMLGGRHLSAAVAMEDSEVCVIRLSDIDRLAAQLPSLQQQVRNLMSREITRSHELVAMLGGTRAEQRLATFLLGLSQRYASLGYSASEFVLRMSRDEIGNYLGLSMETVSRLFSRFARERVIQLAQRDVRILDPVALKALADVEDC
ncbi:helix-turn-helix domain-containing protein [Bordetella genomosp. 13]|uniref:Transcriptional regulator n=1 Tax=Bordetella genomosp. 13 TaxID=463040 RepID=A0A1W6ZCE5_9BORD|nr:helix-turn-helix domain-containing protein [Bordetella genomosp. 13]ARP94989.1 transcriptional regulator [Bordetella genomosp. 13]